MGKKIAHCSPARLCHSPPGRHPAWSALWKPSFQGGCWRMMPSCNSWTTSKTDGDPARFCRLHNRFWAFSKRVTLLGFDSGHLLFSIKEDSAQWLKYTDHAAIFALKKKAALVRYKRHKSHRWWVSFHFTSFSMRSQTITTSCGAP